MDFPNAQLPALTPLQNSIAQSNFPIENDLRNLFIQLFSELLAESAFDANVLGMMHLGSLNLVRKAVNADGLVLLAGDREETATRYLYRAWKSRNCQGRGLHFLRTYLQLLFPNAWTVYQLAQAKALPYPTSLINANSAKAQNTANYFLTSRIAVLLDYKKVSYEQLNQMKPVLRSVIPARLTLDFALLATFKKTDYMAASLTVSQAITIYPYNSNQSLPNKTDSMTVAIYSHNNITIQPFSV